MTEQQQAPTAEDLEQQQTAEPPSTEPEESSAADETNTVGGEGDSFPREYVERLRAEAATARQQRTEERDARAALEADLWTARVSALGTLADPSDLPHPPGTEPTAEAVAEAVAALLEAKPHLARRRVTGSIGQGEGTHAAPVSLAAMLAAGA